MVVQPRSFVVEHPLLRGFLDRHVLSGTRRVDLLIRWSEVRVVHGPFETRRQAVLTRSVCQTSHRAPAVEHQARTYRNRVVSKEDGQAIHGLMEG